MNKEWMLRHLSDNVKPPSWRRYLEVFILMMVILLLLVFGQTRHMDVWFYSSLYMVFPLLIVTLLLGILPGILGLFVYFVGQYITIGDHYPMIMTYRESFGFLMAITFLSGLFHLYWQRILEKETYLRKFVKNQLNHLTKEYYVMRLSHARLEQQYMTKTLSLRQALYQIQQLILDEKGQLTKTIASKLMALLSEYATLTNAILFIYDNKDNKVNVLATVGASFKINEADPLMQKATDKQSAYYVGMSVLKPDTHTEYLAVLPLISDDKVTRGYLVIKDMPFTLLTEDNLMAFQMMLTYLGSCLYLPSSFKNAVMHVSYDKAFLLHSYRLSLLSHYFDLDSVIMAIRVPKKEAHQWVLEGLMQQKRTLDAGMVIEGKDAYTVFILLGLSHLSGAFGYRERLKAWLIETFGEKLTKQLVITQSMLTDEGTVDGIVSQLDLIKKGLK